MKNYLLMFIVVGLMYFQSCSKKDYDPELQGKWQLRYEIRSEIWYKVDTIFYNFDNNVFAIQLITAPTKIDILFGGFTQKDDSLLLEFVDEGFKNSIITKPAFGWSDKGTWRSFRIVKISSNELRLKDKNSELLFRKF